MSYNVGEICEVFFNLEEKYNLNYWEVQGCFPWQLIRMYLYYDIARCLNTFGSAQQQSLSFFDKVKSVTPFIKNSLLYNPFKGNYTRDILIFDHPRKTIFNDEYVDIYSYFLVDLIKDNYSFEVMEAPYFNKHVTKHKNYIKYTDRIQFGSYIYKKFNKIEFSESENDLIFKLKKDIKKIFNLEVNLEWILKTHILNFKYDYKKYTELFQKRKPKMIFVVVAYENQAIVKAAKDLGIEVIELQHGTITDYHLGYSYPKKSRLNGEIAYFPDKILTFGDYWINDKSCPIDSKNIIPIGFPYFEAQSKDFLNINKKNKQILFISQGVIGKYLSKIAYDVSTNLKDFNIVYKLHPGEYETWRSNYPELAEADKLDNFTVIDNSKTPLYQFFAESRYQVGAFSTAIYEGLMFNCKTFIVDVPGVEYLKDLIEKNYVCKVKDSKELVDKLDVFEPEAYDNDFFFKNFDKRLLKKVIDSE